MEKPSRETQIVVLMVLLTLAFGVFITQPLFIALPTMIACVAGYAMWVWLPRR